MAAKKRTGKLKVFRTPIGFHDAYVAAPSQKAALEAWGSQSNLFAQGAAELVTDSGLAKVPLQNPGRVVKVLRGTAAEQVAALGKQSKRTDKRAFASKPEVLPAKPKKRLRRPSRAALEAAQEVLEHLKERHQNQLEAIERKRRELMRRHERERDKAAEKLEFERERYQSALERYESG